MRLPTLLIGQIQIKKWLFFTCTYILVTEPRSLVKLIGHYYVATIPLLLSSCDSTYSTADIMLTTHYDLQQQCEEQFNNSLDVT